LLAEIPSLYLGQAFSCQYVADVYRASCTWSNNNKLSHPRTETWVSRSFVYLVKGGEFSMWKLNWPRVAFI
jgi:hypothetical protein